MRRNLFALLLLCAACVGLCACKLQGGSAQTEWPVYYVVTDSYYGEAAVDLEYCTLPEGCQPVPALMQLLFSSPQSPELASPFPEGMRLLSWELTEGCLRLNLSEQYGGLTGVDLTLADSCTVLTLCQIEGVESVSITVEGREIPFRRSQKLCPEDVLLPEAAGASTVS